MPKPFKPGCASPPKTVVLKEENKKEVNELDIKKEEDVNMIKVGRPAPEFELSGYHNGEFKSFSLSEFKGKWVLLCFYPGDFTFV